MKKIITLILVLVMAFGLCACGTQHIDLDSGGAMEFDIGGEKIAGNFEGYSVHQMGDSTVVVIDIGNG